MMLLPRDHAQPIGGRTQCMSSGPSDILAAMAKKKKVRVDLRKNRSKPPRDHQWTRGFQEHGFSEKATTSDERVRAKGDLSRRRTIIQNDVPTAAGDTAMPAADAHCLPGRVLRVHGLISIVE